MILREAQQPGALPKTRMCAVLGLSRPSLYRTQRPSPEELAVRDAIQRICAQYTDAGYRYVTKALRRRGLRVNSKRVRRLMHDDHLVRNRRGKRKGPRYVAHGLPTYPNLAKGVKPTRINQLWIADLTYVRLRWMWIFVAVILDAFSRRCIGWALGRHLDTVLPLTALRMALARRRPAAGLIHHSDRGVQYASREYVQLLRERGVVVSMSRAGNPYDNAICERFMRTLKQEEIYARDYDDLADAQRRIVHFIDAIYNRKRLHSAIGYVTPVEFEQQQTLSTISTESTAATTTTNSSQSSLTDCLT
jgi:putative transposase